MSRIIDTDKDTNMDYEKASFFNYIILPFLWILGVKSGEKLIAPSGDAIAVKRHATKYQAIEILYNYQQNVKSIRDYKELFITRFWFNLLNPKAVRNRLKLVKKEVREEILKSNNEIFTILSIASGSARAIIETVKELPQKKILVYFLDKDENALSYSKELAKIAGIESQCTWVIGRAEDLTLKMKNISPHLVEMVGLLDYLKKDVAVEIISEIKKILSPGGLLITCNILDNPERRFVTKVINWKMIYRSIEELTRIVKESGFEDEDIEVKLEPLKIHALVECRRK